MIELFDYRTFIGQEDHARPSESFQEIYAGRDSSEGSMSAARTEASLHPDLILAICCSSLFLATMDITIVNVALPSIQRDLGASISGLQWSIDGYTLVSASFLMLAGSTADRIGRKTVFQTGIALFSLGSLMCSLSSTTTGLVLCRGIQALGGSMLNPVAVSIISNTFTAPRERARAIGLWGAVAGISMVAGPLLGGFLTQSFGWRSIFWINVPIGIVAFALTARFIPESRAQRARRFDPVGQALVVIALATIVSSLIEGPRLGWTSFTIVGAFIVFVTAMATLVVYEKTRFQPLVDIRFFHSIRFSSATVMAILAFLGFSGFLFLNSLYLQNARGFPPTLAGLCLLPMALMMMLLSPVAGRLVGYGHARLTMVIAGIAITCGAIVLILIGLDSALPRLLGAYALFGVGFGMINAPITNAAVSSMPNALAGLAAAFSGTSRQVGASLGVALAGSFVGTAVAPNFMSATQPFWWLVAACGLAIVGLGVLSTSEAARRGDLEVARLLEQTEDNPG
jgi:EmrB/QacA subfamily drug resistance transporter